MCVSSQIFGRKRTKRETFLVLLSILMKIEFWDPLFLKSTYELHESHSAQHLADHLTKTCLDWGLTAEKITAVGTDGGNNIVYLFFLEEYDFSEYHHKIIQGNWRIRNRQKLLEEFGTGSQALQSVLSVYYKSLALKLKDDTLKFYHDNYHHKNSYITKVTTKYLSVTGISPTRKSFLPNWG
ncbi:hypothetical protein NPIL_446641 [Nephila pilipes]|uniref:Uncharacterized protein n=1 Tax=Nephila pilipes TaxID=299642 RepID=A0A8X6PNB1_NEPPI|nr:hypothetical protein NPIL_446641 [Nephila pilipes]